MSIVGIFIAAFEFFLYSLNRKEYFKLLDEYDDMRKPMMNATMSMSTIHSKTGSCGPNGIGGNPNAGHSINFGPQPVKFPPRSLILEQQQQQQNTPSMNSTSGLLPQMNSAQYSNPLQTIQNLSGRFNPRPRGSSSINNNMGLNDHLNTPSDRVLYEDQGSNQIFE